MRLLLLTFGVLLLSAIKCVGQAGSVPKNLKQAVRLLDIDCPDSLKNIIKITKDKDLAKLSYPSGRATYRTIFDWTKNEDHQTKISAYLKKRSISLYQTDVIMVAFKYHLLGQKVDERLICEPFQITEKKWAKEDLVRYTTDSLRGVYIPIDLDDCIGQMDLWWGDSTKIKVKKLTEDEFNGHYHMGAGMWMRNNWQLWGGSRLSKYFNDKGIYHPDDMSGIILTSFHRCLNKKPIALDSQIAGYQQYWAESKREDLKRTKEEFERFKIGDTILYKYNLGYSTTQQKKKYDLDSCVAKGTILERNSESFSFKILLIDACDNKGLIFYDNKDIVVFNKRTGKWKKPKRHIVKYMKPAQTNWFAYTDWEH